MSILLKSNNTHFNEIFNTVVAHKSKAFNEIMEADKLYVKHVMRTRVEIIGEKILSASVYRKIFGNRSPEKSSKLAGIYYAKVIFTLNSEFNIDISTSIPSLFCKSEILKINFEIGFNHIKRNLHGHMK